jgi:hypothetical protein
MKYVQNLQRVLDNQILTQSVDSSLFKIIKFELRRSLMSSWVLCRLIQSLQANTGLYSGYNTIVCLQIIYISSVILLFLTVSDTDGLVKRKKM